MSHQPERKEKNCLNCGVVVAGRFCQKCGQENIETKQSAGALVRHFVYDIFHFDGKFYDTMKRLLFRPGLVPKEYVAGKRSSYLDPIRMYLFTSAVFFLVFFSKNRMIQVTDDGFNRSMTTTERLQYASLLHNQRDDSIGLRQLDLLLDTTYRIKMLKPGAQPLSDSSFLVEMEGRQYLMAAEKKDTSRKESSSSTWFQKKLERSGIDTNTGEAEISRDKIQQFIDSFIHKMPYLLFISLPFFALILKMLYAKNKNFYYSDHAIFTLYHYIFSFLLLLLFYGVDEIRDSVGWGFLRFLQPVIFVCGGIYLYIAMLKFYGQKWGKTIWKFLLLNFLGFVMLMFLFLVFLIFSFIQS